MQIKNIEKSGKIQICAQKLDIKNSSGKQKRIKIIKIWRKIKGFRIYDKNNKKLLK